MLENCVVFALQFWIDSVEDKEIRDLVTPLIENDRGEYFLIPVFRSVRNILFS